MKAYHLTDPRNVSSILQEGLRPDAQPQYHVWGADIELEEDKVFLAANENAVIAWAKELAWAMNKHDDVQYLIDYDNEEDRVQFLFDLYPWYFIPFAMLEVELDGLRKIEYSFLEHEQIEVGQHIPPERITYLGKYTLIDDFYTHISLPEEFDSDDMMFW